MHKNGLLLIGVYKGSERCIVSLVLIGAWYKRVRVRIRVRVMGKVRVTLGQCAGAICQ